MREAHVNTVGFFYFRGVRMNRPLSSISLGLRVIPPSAGLARTVRRPVHRPAGHHIPTGRRYNLSVARDEELEKEIKHWRNGGIDG